MEERYQQAVYRRREIIDLRLETDRFIRDKEPKLNMQFGAIADGFESVFGDLRSWTVLYHKYDETWAEDPLLTATIPFAPVGREECQAALLHGLVETMTKRVFLPFGIGLPGAVDQFLSRVSEVLATTDEGGPHPGVPGARRQTDARCSSG